MAIAHRGGDVDSIAREGSIALAYRGSWMTPESVQERQPVIRSTPASWLVADARIDNRCELAGLLGIPMSGGMSDAQLISLAYERWGRQCVERLVGDFAFVRWDSESRELFCARDPMGVRPLYYFESEGTFAFASELRALLVLPEVPRDVDPLQVALFLEGTIADRHRTHYKAISRLPAAHSLTIDSHRARSSRYWQPDAERELRLSNSEEYVEAFREIFREAVRSRLRTIHPVGAALSGGLDSSSIVCTARELGGGAATIPLQTFSLVFPSLPERELKMIDERRYIESVVRGGSVLPTFVRGDELSPVADIDDVLERLDEPYPAPNLYLHWAMYRAARERGARVFLDGFDGDTTVSHGFARFNDLVQRGQWDTFEREVRALATRRRVAPASILPHFGLPHLAALAERGSWVEWTREAGELRRRFGVSLGGTAFNYGLRPAAPPVIRKILRQLRRLPGEASSLLDPDLARALRASDYASDDEAAGAMSSERESHAKGLAQPAYQLTLEMADQSAAAFGLEPRYPFFDRRLIDFCLSVPDVEKFADGWPRLLFRRAMEGILPPEIQWRPDKGNLSPNFHRSLRAAQAVAPTPGPDSPLTPYVDLRVLRQMRHRYCAETSTPGRSADGHALFRAMVLERWLSANDGQRCAARLRSSSLAPAAA